jgi:hypothetical protein
MVVAQHLVGQGVDVGFFIRNSAVGEVVFA